MDPTVQELLERNKYCFTLFVLSPRRAKSFIKTVCSECFTSTISLRDLICGTGTSPHRHPSVFSTIPNRNDLLISPQSPAQTHAASQNIT